MKYLEYKVFAGPEGLDALVERFNEAGFYGIIIDMTDDTVIVEFGNNKNCRIPMQKAAIVQVEKPDAN